MKKKLITAACLLFSGLSFAQDITVRDVPSVVLNSFIKTFPKANDVDWEKKGDRFNVEFEIGRRDHEAWLNQKGEIMKHKKEITARELPAIVKRSIKENYKGYRIDEVDQVEEARQIFYRIELKTLTDEKEVVLDQSGKLSNKKL